MDFCGKASGGWDERLYGAIMKYFTFVPLRNLVLSVYWCTWFLGCYNIKIKHNQAQQNFKIKMKLCGFLLV